MTTVAIQGEPGAFSHQAALQAFGSQVGLRPCRTFESLFEAVMSGDADQGIVPVENTLAGSVQRSMDLLAARPLHVIAEVRVAVDLCLIVPPGGRLAAVRAAASHPVALDQCHGFFEAHPRIARVVAYDTAGSVRDLMRAECGYDAAIASRLAAALYGAEIVAEKIQDEKDNFTRFLVVSRDPAPLPAERPKTSLAFTTPHRPGSLHRALGILADRGVDLTRLESRPIPGRPWEYRFFADLRGRSIDCHVECVEALRELGAQVRVLGHYREETSGGS